MAATGLEGAITGGKLTRRRWLRLSSGAASTLLLPAALRADRSEDIMAVITYVATALTAGNDDDALVPFDRALAGYSTLASYFAALAEEVTVRSNVELLEEKGSESESNAVLRWALDLRERVSNEELERREREVKVQFVPAPKKAKYGVWKIVAFDDIELFNPSIKEGK